MPKRFPTIPAQLQQVVEAKVEEVRAKFTAQYGSQYLRNIPFPVVKYDLGGSMAGQAIDIDTVRLNPVLLLENRNQMIHQTLPHEICHLIQHYYAPRSSAHGIEWQRLMRAIGLNPHRCHDMDTTNAVQMTGRKKRKFQYKCSCSDDIVVSSVRHNRMSRGTQTYHCTSCKENIEYVRELGQLTMEEARTAANSKRSSKKHK